MKQTTKLRRIKWWTCYVCPLWTRRGGWVAVASSLPLWWLFVVWEHQVVLQGFVQIDKGFSPSVFLVPLRLSSPVGCVDHGQHCPFKVFFLEDPWVRGQPATQSADLCDAFGDNLIADGVKLSSLPQWSELLIFDGDPLTFVNVKLS